MLTSGEAAGVGTAHHRATSAAVTAWRPVSGS